MVTTSRDVVNANDGVISLREAVMAANIDPDADTITFEHGLTDVSLRGHLDITSELVIQGAPTGNLPDLTISADGAPGDDFHFDIAADGDLTLEFIVLADGSATGADGADGADGIFDGFLGSPGEDGQEGANGEDVAASIYNDGALRLDNVVFTGFEALGGDGGDGGEGGDGGDGGDGDAFGLFGGDAGDGGDGGDGGDAQPILGGTIEPDSGIFLSASEPVVGRGGDGGNGGDGGFGGDAGTATGAAPDGEGGEGGNGGDGGDGGSGFPSSTAPSFAGGGGIGGDGGDYSDGVTAPDDGLDGVAGFPGDLFEYTMLL